MRAPKKSKTTPCKVAAIAAIRQRTCPTTHLDTSGDSGVFFYYSEMLPMPVARHRGPPRRACSPDLLTRKSKPRRLPANGTPARGRTRAHIPARLPGKLDMTTTPDLTMPSAIAATAQSQAVDAPRIVLSPQGFSIDHPDPARGEQLMAQALGVADRDAMEGLLRQLVRASVTGGRPDAVNVSFMLSIVQSIKPRDTVEAMLVAQMVSVHMMAMRCAHHLANADDIAQHDSAARALGRLARTFPAQIEALNRHRSQSEPAITVQNVSVGDGGNAIVGNVTQHSHVIVSDKSTASAARHAPKAARSRRRRDSVDATLTAQA
jgi:hypothetical protein